MNLNPPFQRFNWDDYFWTDLVQLPAWAGLQLPDEAAPGDGAVEVRLMAADDKSTPPSPEQAAAYEYLVGQAPAVREALLAAVFEWYQEEYLSWREENDYDEAEAARNLPELSEPVGLAGLISLSNIKVFRTAKDGLSYTGYEFACSWEEEHGLGAMMHGSRVVEIGGADTAVLEWIAARDAEPGK